MYFLSSVKKGWGQCKIKEKMFVRKKGANPTWPAPLSPFPLPPLVLHA